MIHYGFIRIVGLIIVFLCGFDQACAQSDTVINAKHYAYVLYDLNGTTIVIGEDFTNQIRNGEWMQFDQNGMVLSWQHYRNDSLFGMASHYFNFNPGETYRMDGYQEAGTKTGVWAGWKRVNNGKWKRTSYSVYDFKGNEVSRIILHPNGRHQTEYLFSEGLQTQYIRVFDKKGKLTWEGKELPVVNL